MNFNAQMGSALPAGHHQLFDFNEALLQPSVELFCRLVFIMDSMDEPYF